jgi:hypothetical protein
MKKIQKTEHTNMIDRRKFNFNLLIVTMLIVIFSMQLYNQKLLLNIIGGMSDVKNLEKNIQKDIHNIKK